MYRILLADDEGIMLESLKNIIESTFSEECEIYCAKTGRAVVELAQAHSPDICFMDIQMPGLNGIQAIKEIKKFNQSVIFIVVTAYDKFTYAKEAINLGVFEFLTKPVNRRTIVDICTKAMGKVDEIRQKRSDDLKIREKLETVVPMLESGYINNLLLQDDFRTYQDNYRQLLDIKEEHGYMLVVEYGDNEENGILTNAVGASVRASKFYSTFREICKDFFECLVGPVMGSRIILLVPFERESVTYEERVQILSKARNMIHKLETRIESKFRCGIGRIRKLDSADVKESYSEALCALREGKDSVMHIEDTPLAQKYDGEYPRELEKQYFQRVISKDTASAIDCAQRFFAWMLGQQGVTRDDVEIKVLELVMAVEKKAFFAGGVKYGFRYRGNYIRDVQSCVDYDQLKEWFLRKTKEVCQNMETAREKESVSIVENAKKYIDENFHKDVSLDDVSRIVDISPFYFSKLFKQEVGKNFIEYLTDVRLQNAKILLNNPQYSIKEVCVMSGYSDPNYFSRIFKKYEGVTPSEYRERLG